MKLFSKFLVLLLSALIILPVLMPVVFFADEDDQEKEQFIIQFNTFSSRAEISNQKFALGEEVHVYKQGEQISASAYMLKDGYTLVGWTVCLNEIGVTDTDGTRVNVYYSEKSNTPVPLEQATIYTDKIVLNEKMLVDTPLGKRAFFNAIWKADSHKVTFKYGDKELAAGYNSAVTGEEIILPERPEGYGNAGQAFAWQYGGKNYAPGSPFVVPVYQDKTKVLNFTAKLIDKQCQFEIVYAVATKDGFHYSYGVNDSGIENSVNGIVNYLYGAELKDVLPAPAQREGFTFAGWYTDSNCTVAVAKEDTSNFSYAKVYAKWVPVEGYKFSVNYFDEKGNELTSEKKSVAYGTVITVPGPSSTLVAANPGYTFGGWQGDNMLYMEGMTLTVDSNINLTATWIPNNLTLTLICDGKTNVSAAVAGQQVNVGVRTKAGCKFVGWYDEEGSLISLDGAFVMPSKSLTLTARFDTEYYTVRYKNEYTGSSSETTVSVDNKIVHPKAEEVEGYRFVSWTDQNGNKISDGSVISSDLDLTAVYSEISYTVTYRMGEDSYTETVLYSDAVDHPLKKPENLQGYRFSHFEDEKGNRIALLSLTADATVTVVVEEMFYKVTLINSNTGERESITVSATTPDFSLPEADAPKGYTFAGWKNDSGEVVTGTVTLTGDAVFTVAFDVIEDYTPTGSSNVLWIVLTAVFSAVGIAGIVIGTVLIMKSRKKVS